MLSTLLSIYLYSYSCILDSWCLTHHENWYIQALATIISIVNEENEVYSVVSYSYTFTMVELNYDTYNIRIEDSRLYLFSFYFIFLFLTSD